MIQQNAVTVKMENGVSQAKVNWSGVEIQDARGDSPRMITMMDLDDAIAVAKAILSFAEGMEFDEEDARDAEAIRRYEQGEEARWDAMSAHYDFD